MDPQLFAHLASLEALCREFPDALIIMNHRDPLQTVPWSAV